MIQFRIRSFVEIYIHRKANNNISIKIKYQYFLLWRLYKKIDNTDKNKATLGIIKTALAKILKGHCSPP